MSVFPSTSFERELIAVCLEHAATSDRETLLAHVEAIRADDYHGELPIVAVLLDQAESGSRSFTYLYSIVFEDDGWLRLRQCDTRREIVSELATLANQGKHDVSIFRGESMDTDSLDKEVEAQRVAQREQARREREIREAEARLRETEKQRERDLAELARLKAKYE